MSIGIRPPPPSPKYVRSVALTVEGVVVFHRLDRTYRWGLNPGSKQLTEAQFKRYVSDRNHASCIGWALTYEEEA